MTTPLNPEQQRAVEHTHGPLLIIAGAGTGKTTVIVEKIKHLIANKQAQPDEILALTFTEKSAQEMEERVDKAMPYGTFQMEISTFHSFADQLLRDEISHIGLNPAYKLLTEAEAISFVKRNLFIFNLHYFRPLGNPTKFIDAMLQHFSRLRDEDVSPEQYAKWAADLNTDTIDPSTDKQYTDEEIAKFKELAHAYETYQKLKIQQGYFDFSDLMFYVLQLFRARPTILNRYRKQYKYVLVDEFQDTNIGQYLLIKLLVPPGSKDSNLMVVGDDSQAIYKFRGASVSNILQFMKDYSDAKSITLIRNYRSNQPILDASYKLIKHNDPDTLEAQLGISKKLVAKDKKNKKDTIIIHISDTGEAEADYVVKQILEQTSDERPFSDFAILVRANKHAEPFTAALGRNSIPYRFWGPGRLFKQPEIKELIAYLQILANIEDSSSFYRLTCMDIFAMDEHDISLLMAFAKKTALPLFSATEIYTSFFLTGREESWYHPDFENYKKYLPLLSEKTRSNLVNLVAMIRRHMKLLKNQSAGQILYYFLEDTGYLKKLATPASATDVKVAQNISAFFTRLKKFEAEHEDGSVFATVDFIQMSMDLGESPTVADDDVTEYDGVNILTVHGAKGLEFPVVFLVNLSHGRFPPFERREPIPIPDALIKEVMPQGDYHVLEERRLFYVAVTRAKEKVYLTSSRRYGDGKRDRKISGFVTETVGEDIVSKHLNIKQEEKQQLSIFDFKPTTPSEGSPIQQKSNGDTSKKPLALSQFSFSQLESYELCPLRYKYQYILKIPTSASSAASFGDSIHRSLQKFYQDYLADPMVNLDNLLHAYKQNWIPLGYASKAHENRMKAEGEKMLTKFYSTFHAPHTPPNAPVPLISPTALEKLFKIKVDDTIYVTGKIDRIDRNANDEIEIIDYKTGKKPEEKELKKSLQLSIYALAATDKGLLNVPVDKVNLTFYYLQSMEKFSMKRTKEELIEVRKTVRAMADNIRTGDFKPKVGIWCDFCPFRMVCDAWQ